jgi:hypothetical protein
VLTVRHPEHELFVALQVRSGDGEQRIQLSPLITLRGFVVDGRRFDPVTRFSVTARPVDDPPPRIDTVADALALRRERGMGFQSQDGSFSLSGLTPGSYDVVVRAPGYKEAANQRIFVLPGQKPLLRVEMIPAAAIRGRVVARDGSAVTRVPVFLIPLADEGSAGAPPRGGMRRATTNGNGRFAFGDLDPRRYRLGIGNPRKPVGEPIVIDLDEGQIVEHQFGIGEVASLAVDVEGLGAFAVERATVTLALQGMPLRHRSRTDGRGAVRFANLIPGAYKLTIEAAGYERKLIDVTLDGGDRESERVYLAPK